MEQGIPTLRASLSRIDRADGGFVLRCDGAPPTAIRARFVVDATGPRAAVARALGAKHRFLDRLVVVSGFFDATDTRDPSQLTLLEADPEGWWYSAALPQARCVAAFASDPDLIRREQLGTPRPFLARIGRTKHLRRRLQGCRPLPSDLLVRSAPSALLDPAAGGDWLAVGDAASMYDPLSAQGIYKALSDGLRAADALAGGPAALAGYAAAVAESFEDFRTNRAYFYGLVDRWPQSAFWRRRREHQPTVGS